MTTIVVVEALHGPFLMVRHEDLSDLDKGTIQPLSILFCNALPCRETNVAAIQSIAVNVVTCKLILNHHAHVEMKTNAPIIQEPKSSHTGMDATHSCSSSCIPKSQQEQ